jgi:hypothetical protein
VLLALSFLYVFVRAALLSITHDEALTHLIHVQGTLREILLHTQPIHSNNHLLNTLLIKAGTALFGATPLALRAPALAGCGLYLFATWRTLRLFTEGARRLALTALFATNPLLLEFFGLARGYGLGIGFLMLALYFLLARHLGPLAAPRSAAALPIGCLAIATLANLSFVYPLLALTAAITVLELRGGLRHALRAVLLPSVVAFAVLAAIYNPAVIARIQPNVAHWGGVTGFWNDTVGSLVAAVLYGQPYANEATVHAGAWLVAGLLAGAFAVAAHGTLWETPRDPLAPAIATMLATLVLVALGVTVQFHALGTLFPIGRGAMHLVPPFLILVALTWEYAGRRGPGFAPLRAALAVVIAAGTLHGVLVINTTHTHAWRYDAGTKTAMRTIDRLHAERSPGRPARLATDWRFTPAANFYRVVDRMTWLEPVDRSGPDRPSDYYYLLPEDLHLVAARDLRVVAVMPHSNAIVAVPR